ncbi:MBL fold metallo-hydrolase [Desulfobacterales bacterium HSG2]|nr:MBL fold metallo-hydrolase [Desulfobacterales bacterium HSG2]
MRPSFHPRMVNGPFDDPSLFIPFFFEKRAIIFDAGEMYSLSARDMLKISHVFVTHTHIDHFAGFDRLLRLFLGREKKLHVYGPEGFLKNVEGKLAGYSWNLVRNYTNQFAFQVTEVRSGHTISREYPCRNRFHPTGKTTELPFDGILLREPALSVSAIILDHSIPCLGFSIKERFHVNIIKESLAGLGLEVGPWLREFKEALFNRCDPDSEFEVKFGKENRKKFVLGDLAEQIAIVSPGQKITYVTDVVYSSSNSEKIVGFAKDSDHLFIEAAFLEEERDMARQKYHLTARQAGHIAGRAQVRQFTLFHFSPRYVGMEHILEEEARKAYLRQLSVVSR